MTISATWQVKVFVPFGSAMAIVGARLNWLRGVDNLWSAFENHPFWLEANWIDMQHADGRAIILLACVAAILALVTMVGRLDYWLPIPIVTTALFALALKDLAYVRDRGEAQDGILLVVFGSGIALVGTLADGRYTLRTAPRSSAPAPRSPEAAQARVALRASLRSHAARSRVCRRAD